MKAAITAQILGTSEKKLPYRRLRFTTRESMFGNDLFKNETLIG
jgi:hypothetical protein